MALTPQGPLPFKHVDQVDRPTPGTYTPTQLKEALDSTPEALKTTLNNLIIALEKTTATSGAEQVGSLAIADLTGTTIHAQLLSLRDQLKSIVDGFSGADFIAATAIADLTGGTVQALLEALKAYTDLKDTAQTSALTTHKTSADHDGRYFTETELQSIVDANSGADKVGATAVTDLTGTTVQAILESLRNNLKSIVDGLSGADFVNSTAITGVTGTTVQSQLESIKSLIDLIYTKAQLDAGQLDNRYFTETELNNGQLDSRYYSKTQMQTSGQSQLHWSNLTNVPAMADAKWKAPVALVGDLPTVGNTDGDLRIVLDEDAVYTWDGTTSDWKHIGASGNGISDHGTLIGLGDDDHTQYLRTDGTRTLTGNQNFAQFQAVNLVEHKGTVFPSTPVVAQRFFRTDLDKFYVYKSTGWVDVSGIGAAIKDKEFIATAGQTVFDLTDIGQYEIGTNSLTVFQNSALLRESEYTETSTTSITLITGANLNDVIYVKWFENSPEVINQSVKADGTLQTNLNADMVDGNHFTDIQADAQTKADTAETNAKTYADTQDADLAGVGRTTETIKGNADAVATHLANVANPHAVTKSQVGLSNVDNVQQAPLASPALTGVPTAPTAVAGTNTTQLATTAFVEAARVILAAATALKANTASPTLTGVPAAPTAAAGTNTTQLATTAFATTGLATHAALATHKQVSGVTQSGAYSSAEGQTTTASGLASHAEGRLTQASGGYSHAEGYNTIASGERSHAEGDNTTASGYLSHAQNSGTTSQGFAQTAIGEWNVIQGTTTSKVTTDNAFIIGNGTSDAARANAFRVTWGGAAYGLSAYNATGADYSEFFEWLDGNVNSEDRVGYFVTLDGKKIRKANASDDYILGIVSAAPSIVGDSYDDWQGRYVTDAWGRRLTHEVTVPAVTEVREVTAEDGTITQETIIVVPEHTDTVFVQNPDWNPETPYIPRDERPEWSTIGMLGKLFVRDDGTCVVNGYCHSNDDGIATASVSGYRVIKRVSENIVQVILK